MDSQSVKTTKAGGPHVFDAGKKVNGRKWHLLTDTLELPLRLVVHATNVQDRDGLGLLCVRIRRRFPWLRQLFEDAGSQGGIAMRAAARERLRLAIVRARPRPPPAATASVSCAAISPSDRGSASLDG